MFPSSFLVVATLVGSLEVLFSDTRSVKPPLFSMSKLVPLSRTEITSGGLITSSFYTVSTDGLIFTTLSDESAFNFATCCVDMFTKSTKESSRFSTVWKVTPSPLPSVPVSLLRYWSNCNCCREVCITMSESFGLIYFSRLTTPAAGF